MLGLPCTASIARRNPSTLPCYRRRLPTNEDCLMAGKPTHGETVGRTRTSEYSSWMNMKSRCLRPKEKDAKFYKERGITFCERWSKYENFLADMGRKPSPQHSLERVDNNK